MRQLALLLPLLLGLVAAPVARAATLTWSAAGAGNWSDGANWSVTSGTDADGVPDADDTLVFDATSTMDATIDADLQVMGLLVDAAYTGTIGLGDSTLTVNNQGFQVSGADALDAGTGTVILFGGVIASDSPVNDLELPGPNAYNLTQNLTILGNLMIPSVANVSGAGELRVHGDFLLDVHAPNVTVRLVGDGDQTISGSETGRLRNLHVDKPSGNVILPANMDMSAGTLSGDGVITGDGHLIVTSNQIIDFAGTVEDFE
ncbi:MAG: hypothetical protein AAF533_09765, partial [Acidobacteriota bacterium]